MKTPTPPPEGYHLKNVIDFRYNGKLVLLINLGMVGVTALLIWGMVQVREFSLLLPLDGGYTALQRFMVPLSIVIFLFLYIHVRELLHCAGFALISHKRPKYRMRVFSAACGVPDFYFDKKGYLMATLFPITVITVALAILLLYLSNPWFWVVYIVLAFNVSSGVRDAYVCSIVHDAPKGALLWDDGRIIKIYTPSENNE
ncbi:MAG: DUF3267 domain-containing protein [Clostridiales bacterium]|jgi:hypothetical protein|nr:DUF3267 domain-containing protein [Clostridiales bacterium]